MVPCFFVCFCDIPLWGTPFPWIFLEIFGNWILFSSTKHLGDSIITWNKNFSLRFFGLPWQYKFRWQISVRVRLYISVREFFCLLWRCEHFLHFSYFYPTFCLFLVGESLRASSYLSYCWKQSSLITFQVECHLVFGHKGCSEWHKRHNLD